MFAVSKAILNYPTGVSLDPVVSDWVSRVAAAGGSVAASTQTAMDTYVKGCKSDGIWSLMSNSLIIPLASDGFAGVFEPLVAPSGGTIINNNFVAGDYSLSTGLDPGASNTTKWLDTSGILMSAISGNVDMQLSVYITNRRVQSGAFIHSHTHPTPEFALGVWEHTPVETYFMATANNSDQAVKPRTGVRYNGLLSGSIKLDGEYKRKIFANSTVIAETSTPFFTVLNSNSRPIFFRNPWDTTPMDFAAKSVIGYFGIFYALTPSQETLHYNRVQALQTALGRAV